MIKVYTNLAACCTRVPFILSLNTAAFSDIPEVASSICDNLAMLGGQDRTGVLNLLSRDPQKLGILKGGWENNYKLRVNNSSEI
jgi:hypothetical protein